MIHLLIDGSIYIKQDIWIKQETMVIEKIYHESKSTCAFSKLLLICD